MALLNRFTALRVAPTQVRSMAAMSRPLRLLPPRPVHARQQMPRCVCLRLHSNVLSPLWSGHTRAARRLQWFSDCKLYVSLAAYHR